MNRLPVAASRKSPANSGCLGMAALLRDAATAQFMGPMRAQSEWKLPMNRRRRTGVPPVQHLPTPKAGQAGRAVLPGSWIY